MLSCKHQGDSLTTVTNFQHFLTQYDAGTWGKGAGKEWVAPLLVVKKTPVRGVRHMLTGFQRKKARRIKVSRAATSPPSACSKAPYENDCIHLLLGPYLDQREHWWGEEESVVGLRQTGSCA